MAHGSVRVHGGLRQRQHAGLALNGRRKRGPPLTEKVLHTLLGECVRQKDAALTQRVQRLARDKGVSFFIVIINV